MVRRKRPWYKGQIFVGSARYGVSKYGEIYQLRPPLGGSGFMARHITNYGVF